ncbi:DUF6777 domain-containing protein [Streptomyces sp. NPDC052013]|uniref:DUF6777 domain-containing protein n=1 Tax=Streptomyces sp. NPDC052013 TaxID=3365679 RepID=UPI0037CF6285
MSVEPPSSGRPTGPPSGPLSGRSQPPSSGPPSQPPGAGGGTNVPGGGGGAGPPGTGGGAVPPGPGRLPWWRSVPGVAVVAVAVVAAVILAVVLTRSDGGTEAGGGEVFLQAADASGRDPFTESTAEDSTAPPATPSPSPDPASPREVRGVDGGQPGLYGGTRDVAACDVERQITYLRDVPAKNEAFASVLDIDPSRVPAHLRSLTPLQLRMDTRVTNHGYRDGAALPYQAVLQAGTAVLVDDRGVPRVRCACGNPLTEPVAQSDPRYTGARWPGYDPAKVVVVEPAPEPVEEFVVYDPERGAWFERERGDTGGADRPTRPPGKPTPSDGTTMPSSPKPDEQPPCPPGGATPCPGGSPAPSAPDSEPGTDEPPTEEPPTGEAPTDEPEDGESPAPDSPQPPPPGSGTPPEPASSVAPPAS